MTKSKEDQPEWIIRCAAGVEAGYWKKESSPSKLTLSILFKYWDIILSSGDCEAVGKKIMPGELNEEAHVKATELNSTEESDEQSTKETKLLTPEEYAKELRRFWLGF